MAVLVVHINFSLHLHINSWVGIDNTFCLLCLQDLLSPCLVISVRPWLYDTVFLKFVAYDKLVSSIW